MSEVKYGFRCKLYLDFTGEGSSDGGETWSELDLIADCTKSLAHDRLVSSSRSSPVHSAEPGMIKLAVNIRLRKDASHEAFLDLEAAMKQRGKLSIMALDGPIDEPGSQGFRFDAKAFGWSESQGLQDVAYITTSLKHCIPDEAPQHVTIDGGGDPVFTDM